MASCSLPVPHSDSQPVLPEGGSESAELRESGVRDGRAVGHREFPQQQAVGGHGTQGGVWVGTGSGRY